MTNEHITDERAAFEAWAAREYRHATVYTKRDFEIGLEAWQACATLRPVAQPVGEPVAWECFRDITYFDMWAVRPVGCTTFSATFHVISQSEAQDLCAALMGKVATPQPSPSTAREFVEWMKSQPEDRDPTTIDGALAEFESQPTEGGAPRTE